MQLAAIFGAGGRVGHSVALRFLDGGYHVAVVSRSGSKSLDEEVAKHKGNLRQYRADLSKAEDAVRVWKDIQKDFDSPVSVVLYNAATNSGAATPLEIPLEDLRKSLEINTISVFALAQQAVESFMKLPSSTPKAFIYTGNGLDDPSAFPKIPPGFFTLAQGKGATATLIDVASQSYGPSGQKFYYIDERLEDGGPAYANITGPGHADICWQLSQEARQGEWRVKFVNGKGKI